MMTETMTDLQLSCTRERASRENEDEELRVRRLKLEKVHIMQQEKEASLEEERAELMRQRAQLEQDRRELARQQNELEEGRKVFAYTLAQLGAPKKE